MKYLFLVGLILFSLGTDALAGNNISLTMSCTIPAIPGLNAPLIEQETTKTQQPSVATMQQQVIPQKEAPEETSVIVQEDSQEVKEASQNAAPILMVKTFYSR